MLNVLLVDDEPFILQGLSMLIDWEKEQFEITDMVSNAYDAMAVLEKKTINLVIADIKMPGMSGLELLEYTRKKYGNTIYFVMLSGYSEFEYVRTALKNECLDYILKPVRKDELLSVLKNVRELYAKDTEKMMNDLRMEKAYFIRNILPILYGKYDSGNLAYVRKILGEDTSMRYISVELDFGKAQVREMPDDEKRRLQKELYQKCMQLFPGHEYHCIYDISSSQEKYDVGILYYEKMTSVFDLPETTYLTNLQQRIRECVEFPIIFVIGSAVTQLENLKDSFRSVAVAHFFRQFELKKEKNDSLQQSVCLPDKGIDKQKLDALVCAVEQNQTEEINKIIDENLFQSTQEKQDVRLLNMSVNYLLFQLIHLASEQDENVNQEEVLRYISANAFEQETMNGSTEGLKKLLRDYADYLVQLRGSQAKGVLAQIETDLKENFQENITLKDLSKKYYINAAYLGQIFRKQYGESFKDYLNRIRIEKAASLLLRTDKKIYEIAEEVGYKDIDYFINKFIALKSCTPAKFRKQVTECNHV